MKSIPFDHIYLVNLRQHLGRKLRALEHLKTFGIVPTVFEASDGYMPPVLTKYEAYSQQEVGSLSYFKNFNELEVKRNKHFIESAGAFGYIDTYIRLLKDAKKKGYGSILILEDDVLLSVDFNKRLESFYSKLPDSWKFIGLGASQYGWDSVDLDEAKSQGFYTPKQLDTCGSFAIAIRDTIYDELIKLQSHFEAPFDHLPLGEIYNNYPADCFVAYPYMVMPDVRSSSIRGSRHQLIHAQKMKWEPSLFEYPPKRPIINLIISAKEQIKYLDSFNEENTFPFELHFFIPSLDGLRPFHDVSQAIEVTDGKNTIISPNSGYCIKPKTNTPITEAALISLYRSLTSRKKPTANFEIIDTLISEIDLDRVSVIIPTYKRSENLSKVILSVIEQDYENKEIIVVDDNPKDSDEQIKTEQVISHLIKEYPDTKLIYISQSRNRNGAGARNTGFMQSTGNYICFLDDDDLYLPGRLSLSIDKLRTTPSYIGAVYCGFIGWNGAAQTKKRYDKSNLTKELLSLDYLSHYLHTNTATYKRETVVSINGFDETFFRHQDLEFNLRFFEYYDMSVVPKQLISLRPQPTKTNNQQFGINLFETKRKFLKKFEYIINRFDYATKKIIYDNNWAEVINYVPNEKLFEKYLISDLSNGHLQSFTRLSGSEDAQAKPKVEAKPKPEPESKVESKPESTAKPKVEPKAELTAKPKAEPEVEVKVKQEPEPEPEKKVESVFEEDVDVETLLAIEKEAFFNPINEDLNGWQIKGANVFGLAFKKFILPQQQNKLKDHPKAFFEDSKHGFTRFIGRLLKII